MAALAHGEGLAVYLPGAHQSVPGHGGAVLVHRALVRAAAARRLPEPSARAVSPPIGPPLARGPTRGPPPPRQRACRAFRKIIEPLIREFHPQGTETVPRPAPRRQCRASRRTAAAQDGDMSEPRPAGTGAMLRESVRAAGQAAKQKRRWIMRLVLGAVAGMLLGAGGMLALFLGLNAAAFGLGSPDLRRTSGLRTLLAGLHRRSRRRLQHRKRPAPARRLRSLSRDGRD